MHTLAVRIADTLEGLTLNHLRPLARAAGIRIQRHYKKGHLKWLLRSDLLTQWRQTIEAQARQSPPPPLPPLLEPRPRQPLPCRSALAATTTPPPLLSPTLPPLPQQPPPRLQPQVYNRQTHPARNGSDAKVYNDQTHPAHGVYDIQTLAGTRTRTGSNKPLVRGLKIMQLNACSLSARKEEVAKLVSEFTPHVVALQETWCPNVSPVIPGYLLAARSDRIYRKGGGTMIYVLEELARRQIPLHHTSAACEATMIEFKLGSAKFTLVNVYWPPPGSKGAASQEQFVTLAREILAHEPHMVLGDLNATLENGRLVALEELFEVSQLFVHPTAEPTSLRGQQESSPDIGMVAVQYLHLTHVHIPQDRC